MHVFSLPTVRLFGFVLCWALLLPSRALGQAEEYWTSRVEPLLDKHCLKCHAGVRQQGGLDLRSLETILRGGESGPALVPGKPEKSRLWQFVQPKAVRHMPPDPKKQLSAEALDVFKTWITLLPPAPVAATETTAAWVPEYLAAYKRTLRPHATPPQGSTPAATIDWYLAEGWKRARVEPARRAGDASFARRLYLDLVGRIPTSQELQAFVGDYRGDKRERLVAALLASDGYARHWSDVLDTYLMGRSAGKNAAWSAFLEDAFATNRPWNAVVRDFLVARPAEGPRRGATWFLAARKNSYQAIAEAVAPVAFGVKIGCAQCHNHPLAWEIEQRHYWGLVAAFNRGKNVDTEAGPGIAESAVGGFINFANLKKESQPAALVFLNGKSIPERLPGPDEKEQDSPERYVIPPPKEGQRASLPAVPKFSRREAFADAVTQDNPLLARAFVNLVWGKLLGRGLVQPLDQLDSKHRPSHPELLEWLAQDFERSGYDIRRLMRTLVLTRAYQLDTSVSTKTPPRPELFARALEKPLSAEQLLQSLLVATRAKSAEPALERAFVAAFPALLPETYSPSLQQALFLSNSPLVDRLLRPATGNTTERLLALRSPEAQVRAAFQEVLGRAPDPQEQRATLALLATTAPEKAVPNLLWALITSAEFQVNH